MRYLVLACVLINCLAVALPSYAAREFKKALPGYKYTFPQDHYSHNEYKTEWWYYTGHLESADHKQYGYELTFFRTATSIDNGVTNGAWQADNIYMGHFALSDLSGKKFYHSESLSRPGVNRAGADQDKYHVWVTNWSVNFDPATKKHFLKAKSPEYSIDLELLPAKQPAIHGINGVSQKASCLGCASHYYSLTRINTKGFITLGRASHPVPVAGTSWMDHEFGSNQLTGDQVGWDWFSIQLNDNTEIMLYVMRLKNGQLDRQSSGTIVKSNGSTEHLTADQFTITPSTTWTSTHTGAKYPSAFAVNIPSSKISLQVKSQLDDQELVNKDVSGISYWEGASSVIGTVDGKPVQGQSYVELTGYDKAFTNKI